MTEKSNPLSADVQDVIAYLVGRGKASESALRVLIATHAPRGEWPDLVHAQLEYQRQFVTQDMSGLLDQQHQTLALRAFADTTTRIAKGLRNGKYIPAR